VLYSLLRAKFLPFPCPAALQYALKRWPALTSYLDSGHLSIDNNGAA